MASTPSPRHAPPGFSAGQRRGIRRTTWTVSLIALAIYFGYMILTLIQLHR